MATFKVGDKVRHGTTPGTYEVVYGPAAFPAVTDAYVLKGQRGEHVVASPERMRHVAAYKVGERAQFEGHTVQILSGPHPGAGKFAGDPIYLVSYVSGPDRGNVRSLLAESLSNVPRYSIHALAADRYAALYPSF